MYSQLSNSSMNGFYAKTINFVKQFAKPLSIDIFEMMLIPATCTVAALAFDFLSKDLSCLKNKKFKNANLIKSFLITGFTIFGSILYHKSIKYPFIDQTRQEIVKNSKNKNKSALILFTKNDWNRGFSNHKQLEDYDKLAKNFAIDHLEISSEKELTSLNKKYDAIYFYAHGNEESIHLASDVILTKKSNRVLKHLKRIIKDNGTIGLISCETAKGNTNIAKDISIACPNAFVYAPTDSIHALMGSEYDDNGTPCFNDGTYWKGKNITRVYKNGSDVTGGQFIPK